MICPAWYGFSCTTWPPFPRILCQYAFPPIAIYTIVVARISASPIVGMGLRSSRRSPCCGSGWPASPSASYTSSGGSGKANASAETHAKNADER